MKVETELPYTLCDGCPVKKPSCVFVKPAREAMIRAGENDTLDTAANHQLNLQGLLSKIRCPNVLQFV